MRIVSALYPYNIKFFVKFGMLYLVLLSFSTNAMAQDVTIGTFEKPDGAITSFFGTNYVDPYFATKSLLLARSAGLDVDKLIHNWIGWAIKRQKPDGLFGRYRMNSNGGWETVAESDADDAMLALWLELLYTSNTETKMPQAWQESITKAENQLDKLLDTETGIYHISETTKVGLLMDNSEIYAAFRTIADHLSESGIINKSAFYYNKAQKLRDNIARVFLANEAEFIVSTQAPNGNKFYPDKVAQLFPVLHQMFTTENSLSIYQKWIKENASEWFAQRTDDYPWGIFAILALDMHDIESASCWRSHAEPMRYSSHWNILEEISLQIVKTRLLQLQGSDAVPCVRRHFL